MKIEFAHFPPALYDAYRGVATIRKLLTIICLFCKRALYKRLYSAKETYNFKEPTNYNHPICPLIHTPNILCPLIHFLKTKCPFIHTLQTLCLFTTGQKVNTHP